VKPHSANMPERLKKEMKRQISVVGIFPNESNVLRLIDTVLMGQERGMTIAVPLCRCAAWSRACDGGIH
jgi:transposase-like protein